MFSSQHKHRCSCGFTWQHSDDKSGDDEAHTCRQCGEMVWDRYDGDEDKSLRIDTFLALLLLLSKG